VKAFRNKENGDNSNLTGMI